MFSRSTARALDYDSRRSWSTKKVHSGEYKNKKSYDKKLCVYMKAKAIRTDGLLPFCGNLKLFKKSF